MRVGFEDDEDYEEKREAKEEFRLAWMWVEGWRARLRRAGDIVEKERYDDGRGAQRRVYMCL